MEILNLPHTENFNRIHLMRRSIIISICALNALIALGLLWFTLARSKNTQKLLTPPITENLVLSDDTYWAHAKTAQDFRKAAMNLAQIQDVDTFQAKSLIELEQLLSDAAPQFKQWGFYNALLYFSAANAGQPKDLNFLPDIAQNQAQPLLLRDQAFRYFVEHTWRLNPTTKESTQAIQGLIDTFYIEGNSLLSTALRAEAFLLEKDPSDIARSDRLLKKIKAILGSPESLEINQLTALEILANADLTLPEVLLKTLYAKTDSGRIQTSILRLLASSETLSAETSSWILELTPITLEHEQHIQTILTK